MDGFEEFYRRYYPVMVRMAQTWVGATDAEDVAQTIMIRVLRDFDAVDQGRDMGPWLQTVVWRACRDVRRRDETAQAAYDKLPAVAAVDDVERRAIARERCRTVGRRVRRLPAADRELLRHVVDDLPLAELARRRRMAASAVRVRLFRIRCELRRRAS